MVGMVVLMFLLGWGLGWMDTQWLLSPDSRAAALVPYASLACSASCGARSVPTHPST